MIPQKYIFTKLSIFKKIFLIVLGIFVCFIGLEVVLRFGGLFLSFPQWRDNVVSKQKTDTYRILCLGESTTAAFLGEKPYPVQLEGILNERNIGIQFSVINKGVIAMNTSFIVSNLKADLKEYRPDMVIAMMGINDCGYLAGKDKVRLNSFWYSLRVCKFFSVLWEKVLSRFKDIKIRYLNINETKSINLCIKEACSGYNNFIGKERSFKESESQNKGIDSKYQNSGLFCKEQGKIGEAEKYFRREMIFNHRDFNAIFQLGCIYEDQEKFNRAETLYKKAVKLGTKKDKALVYRKLGELCEKEARYTDSEKYFREAILLDPLAKESYERVGLFYRNRGLFSLAEESYKKALQIDPTFYFACRELGTAYRMQRKFKEAEELFNDFIKINPENDRIYQDLIQLYEDMGNCLMSQRYQEMAESLKAQCRSKVTVSNYRKIKEILDNSGIKFVCVQYPMRNINVIKNMFINQDGIFFVDNEKVFRDAVKQGSFGEYFIDKMFIDFGHCTSKGNRLLAENIANVITKEVFNRN
jgi:tetratricopeptide (TPR) repeat protein